jgi:YD repeat-containing protein
MVRRDAVWTGLALAVLIASQPTGAAAQNLAPNPSFESGTATTATGWTPCQTSGSAAFSIVGSPVHSGTRAARMDVKQSGDTGICSTNLAVSANTGYRLSSWLSAPLGRQAALMVTELRSDLSAVVGKTLATSANTVSGWAAMEGSFVTGPTTSYVQIRLMHSVPGTTGTGIFVWDDVTLSPGDPEIRNPSFEVGPSTAADGWAFYQNSGAATFSLSTLTVHTGARAVRMDVTQSGDVGVVSTRFDVLPNQGYVASGFVKAALGKQASLRIIEWGSDLSVQADRTVAVSSGGTTDWEYLEGGFMTGANTRLLEIRLMHSIAGSAGTGTFFWDDVGFSALTGTFDETRLGSCPIAPSPPACKEASSVDQWKCWQKSLISSGYTGVNAYRDLELTVDFRTSSTNALVRSGWGFWDCTNSNGSEVFRLRTALPPGTYTWETRCRKRSGAPTSAKDCALDKNLNGPAYVSGGTAKGSFTVNPATANNDRYDRGFLTLSSNRKFLKQGTTAVPFFWLGDTAWGSVSASTSRGADWNTYLSSRKQQGFSVLLFDTAPAFAGVSESTAFQKLTNCQQDGPVPNNCSRWMPAYWQQYEAKVQDANANGMVVVVAGIMEPFSYPSPTFGRPQWLSIFGRNLAARLAGHHVIFSPGSDDALTAQTQTLINSVGAAIRQAVPSNQAVPSHLITYHAGGSTRCSDYIGFLQAQTWHDFHLYQSGHCTGNPPLIQPGQEQACDPLRKYNHVQFPNAIDETLEQCVTRRAREISFSLFNASNFTKPVVNGEAVYDSDPSNQAATVSPENRLFLRQTAYLSALSGSFGFTYGSNYFSQWLVQSATLGTQLGPVPNPSTPTMLPPVTNHSAWDMQQMASLFKIRPWKDLVPDPARIKTQQMADTRKMAYAHTTNFLYHLAYLPQDSGNSKIRLDLSPLAPAFGCGDLHWTGMWIQVGSGTTAPAGAFCTPISAGVFEFSKPSLCPTCDWVLAIDRTSLPASPLLASSLDGRMLQIWPDTADGTRSLEGRILNSTGDPVNDSLTLDQESTLYFRKQPVTARDSNGNFFVVWESEFQDGSLWGVFGRKFDSVGQPLGPEFQVNKFTDFDQAEPSVATSASGGAVVVWMSFSEDGELGGIYGQRYDSSNNPVGGEFQVNTTTTGHQGSPLVAMSDTGEFIVAWESDGQDGDGLGIFAQRFDSQGLPTGPEFQVNPVGTGDQILANLVAQADGGYEVSWYDYDAQGNLLSISWRDYSSTGQPVN